LYAFGHGLSYTRFGYAGLGLDRRQATANEHVKVTLTLKNEGERAGDEVAQLYLAAKNPKREHALKELRGFRRVHLQPGEARVIEFEVVPARDLRIWDDAAGAYVVDPGDYEVQVGASSADIRLRETFAVKD
jgi:beta-glucosidase